MLRYYFDLHDNLELHRDEDGRDFASDQDARIGAIRRVSEQLDEIANVGSATKLLVLAVRRSGERDPFAAISVRITSFR